ncbi:hypothetical protein [Microbacterium stercoris]|uniref:TPM domain-containing protein n=1 Tax=Microbacterium stercoris TaxID=2820289 RepID=A0A939TP40_9MICO|nr:hypothetical protein [Microbacterium stercoris]MBO3661995.1 hypothetical protein [Microbacterium stercoris]
MGQPEAGPWDWVLPALVVFGTTAVVLVAAAFAIRAIRRGPAARRRATEATEKAGAALVALDDAIEELELEVGLSGALYGGGAPASLRRTRMTAQHTRDAAFTAYRAMTDPDTLPAEAVRVSRDVLRRIETASRAIESARGEHAAWIATHVSAADQVAAAEGHLAELTARVGDPAALLRELEQLVDREEWTDASQAAQSVRSALAEARDHLDTAREKAADPSRSAHEDLALGERALRRADAAARLLEESHTHVVQAGRAVAGELDAAHEAVRSATGIRAALEPDDAERLGAEIAWASEELARISPTAARRPVSANREIARVRERLDAALADARTAQQRLHGARTALPGTLAAARSAVSRAEAAMPTHARALDCRVRLEAARDELAAARQAADPVTALDAARRAIRHAEDAKALADYARLG